MNDFIKNTTAGKSPVPPKQACHMSDLMERMGMASTNQNPEAQKAFNDDYNQALDAERRHIKANLRKGLFGVFLALCLVLPPVPGSPTPEAPPVPQLINVGV
jgi:hypothetical protein